MKYLDVMRCRNESCQFTLRPVTNTLSDLIEQLQSEDKGVDRVAAHSLGIYCVLTKLY